MDVDQWRTSMMEMEKQLAAEKAELIQKMFAELFRSGGSNTKSPPESQSLKSPSNMSLTARPPSTEKPVKHSRATPPLSNNTSVSPTRHEAGDEAAKTIPPHSPSTARDPHYKTDGVSGSTPPSKPVANRHHSQRVIILPDDDAEPSRSGSSISPIVDGSAVPRPTLVSTTSNMSSYSDSNRHINSISVVQDNTKKEVLHTLVPSNSGTNRSVATGSSSSIKQCTSTAGSDDDDDDIELSDASSTSSDDDGSASAHTSYSKAGSAGGRSSGGLNQASSSGSYGNSPRLEPKRRQSTITQELLSNAQHQQQKLLMAAGEASEVLPMAPSISRAESERRDGSHAAISRSGSISSISSGQQQQIRAGSNASSGNGVMQPIRRQSIADIRKALSISPSADPTPTISYINSVALTHGGRTSPSSGGGRGSSNSLQRDEEAKLGNVKVRKFVTEIRDAMNIFRKETGVGANDKRSLGDASFEELRRAREVLEGAKKQATSELLQGTGTGSTLIVDSTEIKKSVTLLFEDLIKEGDRRGNAEVIEAMVSCISSIDFQSIVLVRQLHIGACSEGFPKFLAVFLAMPKVQEALTASQISQLLQLASAHPVYRIDLLTVIFKYAPYAPQGFKASAELQPHYQEAVEQALSLLKAGSMEDRTHRPELLQETIRCEGLINFSTRDGGDKQTIFSRAAREGDVELIKTLLSNQLVEDVNRVQPDGTNALQQAAARGHVKVVEVLCKLSQIAPSLTYAYPGRGTALELATSAKNKSAPCIQILRQRMIELRLLAIDTKTSSSPNHSDPRSVSPASPAGLTSAARRDSKASFARKKSIALGAEKEDELTVVNGTVDGTNIVKILLTGIKPLYEQIKYEESFDPKGEELRKLGVLKEDLTKAKEGMVSKLQKLEPTANIEIRKEEVRSDVLSLMDNLIQETSKGVGNASLFEVCINRFAVNFDFAQVATERNWFTQAAQNGSTEFVTILLAIPGMKEFNLQGFLTKQMFEAAAQSTIYRIDELLNLFAHEDVLNLDYFQAILKPVWQKIFEEIGALSQIRAQEQKANRMQLLKVMVEHPLVRVNADAIGEDKHTPLSRACADGDAPLVFYLLNPHGPLDGPLVKNANVLVSGNMTALMHACANGRKSVVEVFIQLAAVREEKDQLLKFKVQLQGGNCADVAVRKKQLDVYTLLKAHGVVPLTAQL